ncbi:proline--tRNA ligase [Candidatus Riesia pediculischaeffi]|uniref:proline--tRNA ligase n=1 Tax=Candidatus Riesia pediculischaeffi TaxID=428411 RepID=UPI0009B7C1F5|nr:proline--tRNA ligase [Candidatus Riesia pediculischaeffi]
MRISQYLSSTLTDHQVNSKSLSDRLMIRSGMVRKLSSGIYYWLPTGIKVVEKLKNIIREEMNLIGSIEFSSPLIQPIHLWKKSGRLVQYGDELIRFKDRKNRTFALSPTNEESITYLIKDEIKSYNQLPINLYQIQTKFRDELRPQFGIIRSKEFIMKDAYSFHANAKSLQKTYNKMIKTYEKIFDKVKLKYKIILAENGLIGGDISHEFRSDMKRNLKFNGDIDQDHIKIERQFNMDGINTIAIKKESEIEYFKMKYKKISEILNKNDLVLRKMVKLIVVKADPNSDHKFIAILMRLKDVLNVRKVEKQSLVSKPLRFMKKKELLKILNFNQCDFMNTICKSIPIIADYRINRICFPIIGIKVDECYYIDLNFKKKVSYHKICDLVEFQEEYLFQSYGEKIEVRDGNELELGHLFQIGEKYSRSIGAYFQDKQGERKLIKMGCYGIGVGRMISAIIEQNHDDNGIVWPEVLAPFQAAILPININKSNTVRNVSNDLYHTLKKNRFEVIFYDKEMSFGKMLKDVELIGVPHIFIINRVNLRLKRITYRSRMNQLEEYIDLNDVVTFLKQRSLKN